MFNTVLATSATVLAEEPRPNVVILFTDDQGTLDAHCYGSTDLETPHIDKLAATGVRFTQAYAHTVCCPARAALLTGRHPQRGGVHFWTQGDMGGEDGINMALEEVTLAEALKPAGYRTGLFGKWHLGAHRDFGPKKQGFDEFFGIRDGFIDNYNHYFLHREDPRGNKLPFLAVRRKPSGAAKPEGLRPTASFNPVIYFRAAPKGFHDLYEGTEAVHADGEYFSELMVRRSLQFIEQNQDRPFFLYVAFNIPHYPEQALRQCESLYENMPDPGRKSYAAMIRVDPNRKARVGGCLDYWPHGGGLPPAASEIG